MPTGEELSCSFNENDEDLPSASILFETVPRYALSVVTAQLAMLIIIFTVSNSGEPGPSLLASCSYQAEVGIFTQHAFVVDY